MQKLFAAGFVVLIFSFSVFAKLAPVSLEDLVRNSDVILVGTLTDIAERREDGFIFGAGEIVVNEAVAGRVKTAAGVSLVPGDRLKLRYTEGFACVYGSHRRIENEQVVWFLSIGAGQEIDGADFRYLEALPEIKSITRKLSARDWPANVVKTENAAARNFPAVVRPVDGEEISFCVYQVQPTFYPIPAFLVVIGSIWLYYLLYRSRFRIR